MQLGALFFIRKVQNESAFLGMPNSANVASCFVHHIFPTTDIKMRILDLHPLLIVFYRWHAHSLDLHLRRNSLSLEKLGW